MSLRSILSSAPDLDALALEAAAGNRRAFQRLYRGLYPLVSRYVARRILNSADADDTTARAFEKLIKALDRFDPKRGCIEALAMTISRNLVIDHLRARKVHLALSTVENQADAGPDVLARMVHDEELSALQNLLADCPPELRRLLSLRYGEGLRHRAIAEIMGLSESAVRKRISRALEELRERSQARASAAGEVGYVY